MPDKKPIGHWLIELLSVTKCANLREFECFMASKDITLRNKVVSYDLLKKWSSGQQLISILAAECVLNAIIDQVEKKRLRLLFFKARFLSFLCDLVIAGTNKDKPQSWMLTQDTIFQRYSQLSDIERY